MSEINVTPFVDVMLVLLIVFMVTAPLLTVGVPVDLPKTRAQPLGQDASRSSVTVKRDGKVYLQNTPSAEDELVAKLTAIASQRLRPAHLRARRPLGRPWPGHAGDGPSFRRRLHPIGLVTDVEKPKPEKE